MCITFKLNFEAKWEKSREGVVMIVFQAGNHEFFLHIMIIIVHNLCMQEMVSFQF